MKKKTAEELVKTYPGAFARRNAIILALCQGSSLSTYPTLRTRGSSTVGSRIVHVANKIIEETEQ